jgi:hypothetical protein
VELYRPTNYSQVASQSLLYTRKKTFGYNECSAEKRQIFLEELKDIDPTSLIYLDESGVDNNEVYAYAWGKK